MYSVFVILFGNSNSFAQTTDSLFYKTYDTIYIASEPDYPPYCFVDNKGKADGFAVELFKASADAIGVNTKIKIGLWNVIKQELAEGKIDALPLVGKTPEREKIFDFTIPYLSLHGAVFKRKGEYSLNSLDDLKQKQILVMRGDNAEEFLLRNNISIRVVTTNTFEEAFIKLANGEGDAILTQRVIGLNLIKELELKNIEASKLQVPEFRQDFCFAVQKGDNQLLSRINEGLSIVIANNTYNEIHTKWFGPTLNPKLSSRDIIRIAVIIIVPIVIVVALFFIFFLRREVRRRTKQLSQEVIERRQIEAKAIQERNKAQQYLDIAGVMLLVLDNKGIVQLINPKGCETLGFTKNEIIGKYWHTTFLPEDEKAKVHEVEQKVYNGHIEDVRYFENKIITKSGEERLVAWKNAVLTNDQGEITGTLSSGEDITDQKNNELELIEAKEKAEESDFLKTSFLQNMNHEIRTPMNSIMGFASLLPDEDDKTLINSYSDIIVKNSEQLVHIIDDIVLFSRLQNKQMPLQVRQFDLLNLLNEVKNSFDIPEYQKGVELLIEGNADASLYVNSDHEKVWQVFTNLISNAFKYTQRGEISIGAINRETDYLCFVKETGIGIPEDEIEQIFERFYRASNVNKGKIGGTGLGLSIVCELVQLLGGTIWVESEVGKGCTFNFILPL